MKVNTYLDVLKKEKQYCYMLLANIISRFGDSIDSIAYSWMVYQLTGSKAWLAVIFGINMIPMIVFQPLSGALSEFLNKKRTVILCDLAHGAIVCLTGLLLIFGLLEPWHLLVLTFINATFEALRIPNSLALIPLILGKENYKTAISINQGGSKTANLLGLGVAGFIIGLVGSGGALLVDAVTFLLSAILMSFIKMNSLKEKNKDFQMKNYINTLKEGFVYFKKNHLAVMVCIMSIIISLTEVPIQNLQAAYVSEYLKLDVFAMSVGSSAMTIGMIIGSLFFPIMSKKLSDIKLIFLGGMSIGICYFAYLIPGFLLTVIEKYISLGIFSFAFGFFLSLAAVTVHIIFMTKIPDELVGRIGSIFNALACSCLPAGSFLLAAASTVFSISQIYVVTGGMTIVLFLLIVKTNMLKEFK